MLDFYVILVGQGLTFSTMPDSQGAVPVGSRESICKDERVCLSLARVIKFLIPDRSRQSL